MLGTKVSPTYNFALSYPDIAKTWDYERNGTERPEDMAPKSNKTAHWICPTDPRHRWEAIIANRSRGKGCPYCRGLKVDETNSLETKCPWLAAEWDLSGVNQGVLPKDVTPGCNKKYWWVCSEDPRHRWESMVNNRSKGKGCPWCGRGADKDSNLAAKHPELMPEWPFDLNIGVDPELVASHSNMKVWWRCTRKNHVWLSTVSNRTEGHGCSGCMRYRIQPPENNLAVQFPDISKQWHPTKNEDLLPEYFTVSSGEKVWWQCLVNGEHVWDTVIANRTGQGSGCPQCSGRVADSTNNLLRVHPSVAADWDYELNVGMRPEEFTPSANVDVHWICPVNRNHRWFVSIASRTSGGRITGCPSCNLPGITQLRFYEELKKYIPDVELELNLVKNPATGRWLPLDVCSRSYKLAFEVDGGHHFKPTLHFNSSLTPEQVQRRDGYKMIQAMRQGFCTIRLCQVTLARDIPATAARLMKYISTRDATLGFDYFENEERFRLYVDVMDKLMKEEANGPIMNL